MDYRKSRNSSEEKANEELLFDVRSLRLHTEPIAGSYASHESMKAMTEKDPPGLHRRPTGHQADGILGLFALGFNRISRARETNIQGIDFILRR